MDATHAVGTETPARQQEQGVCDEVIERLNKLHEAAQLDKDQDWLGDAPTTWHWREDIPDYIGATRGMTAVLFRQGNVRGPDWEAACAFATEVFNAWPAISMLLGRRKVELERERAAFDAARRNANALAAQAERLEDELENFKLAHALARDSNQLLAEQVSQAEKRKPFLPAASLGRDARTLRIYKTLRQACPGATDDFLDYVIWNNTAFPFEGGQKLWKQLWRMLRMHRRRVLRAAVGAHGAPLPAAAGVARVRLRARLAL